MMKCKAVGAVSTSYTAHSHFTTIAQGCWGGGGVAAYERESDKTVRSIVDRNPEKGKYWPMHFNFSILNQTAFPEGTRAHKPHSIA